MHNSFLDAYNKTIGKETPAQAKTDTNNALSSEDMKAYVDAKFAELKNNISNEMKQFISENKIETVTDNKVETPQETPEKKEADNNIEKEGD